MRQSMKMTSYGWPVSCCFTAAMASSPELTASTRAQTPSRACTRMSRAAALSSTTSADTARSGSGTTRSRAAPDATPTDTVK